MQLKKVALLGIFFCLFCLSFLYCRPQNEQTEAAEHGKRILEKKNEVILKVEDTIYRNIDFTQYLRVNIGKDYQALSASSLSKLFDNFTEEKILLEAALQKNISIPPEEKKEYLLRLWKDSPSPGKDVSWNEKERQIIYEGLLIEKYTFKLIEDLQVKKEEIEGYYEQHKREFLNPERVEVSQILVKTEEKAIELREKLKDSSEEKFREIARKESKGPEASQGGKMGIFEMGQLPFEIEKVVFSLKEKEISPVVESYYGFHIFRLDKKYQPVLISKEEASPSIELRIMDQKIKQKISEHIQKLKQQTDWEIYPHSLTFPYQRNNR